MTTKNQRRAHVNQNVSIQQVVEPKLYRMSFKILAECPVSKARVAVMTLPHAEVDTPVFMPVGTQGTLKGITSRQLEALDCRIMLGNTYHLGNRPVGHFRSPENKHATNYMACIQPFDVR